MPTSDLSTLLLLAICLFLLAMVVSVTIIVLTHKSSRRRQLPQAPPQRDKRADNDTPDELPYDPAPVALVATTHDARPVSAPVTVANGKVAPSARLPYVQQRYLLSPAERDFFAVLRAAAPPGWYVFPQVRLANLVTPRKGERDWWTHFNRISKKCVDFVLCDATDIAPRLVIELDDSSHNRPDRRVRDAFVDAALESAQLPILHVRWQRSYNCAKLASLIATEIGRARTAPQLADSLAVAAASPAQTATTPYVPASVPRAEPPAAPTQRWACRACGAEVRATAAYCPLCGTPLELAPES